MDERVDSAEYRLKAAHMRKLADQAHSELARAAYLGLEAGWLRLAQKTEEYAALAPYMSGGDDGAESRPT